LFLNETALGCREDWQVCKPTPGPEFYQAQVDWLLHTYPRAMSVGVSGYIWYTIDGPGWRSTGMLKADGTPNPVYYAYQVLGSQLGKAQYSGPVNYEQDIEAYSFARGIDHVQMVWAKADQNLIIQVLKNSFISANTWDGTTITPTDLGNGNYQLTVGFTPIYLHVK
jgi:hypothetical protein